MDKDIVLLDLFSGIGGFSLGLEHAGFNIATHYFSEIDKHAIAIYKYQFKNAINVGSVTTLDGKSITRPNIITFGSPCQDFSLAGKRAGLEGKRSSLIGEAIRIITECQPDLFIWENVKGVFSSNSGSDFWAVIQAFTNIGGYRLEWQLLNTSWFLPQNRERIYLIGHLAKRGGGLIFPIRENDGFFKHGIDQTQQAVIIDTNYLERDCKIYEDIAPTINSRDYKDPKFVCIAQRGRGEENIQQLEPRSDGITNTLTGVQKDNLVVVGNIYGSKGQNGNVYDPDGISPAISSGETNTKGNGGIGSNNAPKIQVGTYRTHEDGKGFREVQSGLAPTIPARARTDGSGQPVIRVKQLNQSTESHGQQPYQQNRVYDDQGIAPALHSLSEKMNIANTVTPDAYLARGERNRDEDGNAVLTSMNDRRIRRLTEIECERLQGFPDNFTEYGDYDGNIVKVSKTQRYKVLGNAVTVRVVEEIGKRLFNSDTKAI